MRERMQNYALLGVERHSKDNRGAEEGFRRVLGGVAQRGRQWVELALVVYMPDWGALLGAGRSPDSAPGPGLATHERLTQHPHSEPTDIQHTTIRKRHDNSMCVDHARAHIHLLCLAILRSLGLRSDETHVLAACRTATWTRLGSSNGACWQDLTDGVSNWVVVRDGHLATPNMAAIDSSKHSVMSNA